MIHFIIKEIATAYEGSMVNLSITKVKYISFTKNVKDITEKSDSRNNIKLRFDSYKFLSINLDKLASFLNKNELRILQCVFRNLSEKDFELPIRDFSLIYTNTLIALTSCRIRVYYSANHSTVLWPVTPVSKSDYAHAVTFGNSSLFKLWVNQRSIFKNKRC